MRDSASDRTRGPASGEVRRRLRHAGGYHLLSGLAGVAAAAPRPVGAALFTGLGYAAWAVCGRDRARVSAHVARARPDMGAGARARFTRRVFVDAALNLADVLRFLRRPPGELVRLVDVEGERNLRAPLAAGQGVVAVTGHIGAWELLAGYFVARGVRVTVLARPLKEPRFESMIGRLRRRLGVKVVHENGDLRAAFRALKRGEVLGVLIDQGRRWPGVRAPFLGRPAHVTTAAAELARRTGAALVPLAIQRRGRRHRITVLPAVAADWEDPGAVGATTAALARAVESLVWQSPAQWSWMYNVWSGPATGVAVAGPEETEPLLEPSPVAAAAPAGRRGKRSRRRRSVASTLVLGLLLAAAACSPGGDRGGSPPARTAPVGEAGQELSQFVLREIDESGRVAWVFRAAEARIFDSRDEVEAEEVHVDFLDDSGAVASVLEADHAVIARRTNDMRARGNVVVRNAEGHELHTEELEYSSQRKKIFTDKFVRVLRGRDVLTGYGLETDPDLRSGEFAIQRQFRATVRDQALPAVSPEAGSEDMNGGTTAGSGGDGEAP